MVKLSPTALIDHARSHEGRKQLRYAGVSLVFVPLGQVLVQVFHWVFKVSDAIAVLITACILTIPNYFANKLLVWRDTSKENLRTQILVFWVAAMLGTALAMAFVTLADRLAEGSSDVVQGSALFIAQLTGYGIVWIARYFFLDRWLFRVSRGVEPTADEVEELHHDFPV